jgi:hypothetical protein
MGCILSLHSFRKESHRLSRHFSNREVDFCVDCQTSLSVQRSDLASLGWHVTPAPRPGRQCSFDSFLNVSVKR